MKRSSLLKFFLLFALIKPITSFALAEICAVLHEDFNHKGDSRVIFTNDNQNPTYLGDSWNNIVSSLYVREGCTVTLYDDQFGPTIPYYSYVYLDHSVPHLYDFNDKASYFHCTCEPFFLP